VPQPKQKTVFRPKRKKNQARWKPFLRRAALVVVIIGLLYYFRLHLAFWATTAWKDILTSFGFGLIIIAAALGVAIWVIWRRRFSASARRWNWFVGGILLALAVWGGLSFFSPQGGILRHATLGGWFGQSIREGITGTTGTIDVTGSLRLAGLVILGIIFIAPHRSWQVASVPFISSWRLLAKISQPRPRAAAPGAAPPEAIPPEMVVKTVAPPPLAVPGEVWQHQRQPLLTPSGWQLPPIDILDKPTEVELNRDDINKRARLIEEALTSYGVETKVVQINIGPTVTQFGVEPGWDRKYRKVVEKGQERQEEISKTRIRVERITSLANDLALALAAPSIRIEAPVPGKSMVGIEVPNTTFGSVSLRSVIETVAFQKIEARSNLAIALGKGAGGEAVAADLARMPHLLIAGATGSGKTVCLDSIICCLLMHNSPDDVRFILIDPKRVELVSFNGMPNLAAPVVVDSDKAIKALRWLNQEMDNRYRQFAQAGVRNIEGYNKDRSPAESLPYLVLIIDELADLMMAAFDEVERTLCRLAQLARATGIHLIVATQRPSVDVVTGLIKANFPSRISFVVTSQVDSRTILDMVGAEKLLGRGDMLYMPSEASRPKRLQGCFISDAEIEKLVYFWGNQHGVEMSSIDFDTVAESATLSQRIASAPDPLLQEAKRLAQEHKHISTSFLQRRLHIGYPRAARLMDTLEQEGLVQPTRPEPD
jgi:DNA segregation ATPase FtsK/SpoIIIE, S-DNA-T family